MLEPWNYESLYLGILESWSFEILKLRNVHVRASLPPLNRPTPAPAPAVWRWISCLKKLTRLSFHRAHCVPQEGGRVQGWESVCWGCWGFSNFQFPNFQCSCCLIVEFLIFEFPNFRLFKLKFLKSQNVKLFKLQNSKLSNSELKNLQMSKKKKRNVNKWKS